MTPRFGPEQTLDEATDDLRRALREVAGADAGFEARVMLEEATGFDRGALRRAGGRPLGGGAAAALSGWLPRRLAGEPFWRVLGIREFWGLPFAVTPAVLDPRPDTETVVEAALAAVRGRAGEALSLLDLGVGSGALLGALLHAWPQARGLGIDLSLPACRVAAANMDRLGLPARATIVAGRWADALADTARFDVIVSNPPYIETAVIATLDRAVRDFDPWLALDGGADGLDGYRIIAAALPRLLAPEGVAVLEVGQGQSAAVVRLLARAGLDRCTTRCDLAGIARAVVAWRGDGAVEEAATPV